MSLYREDLASFGHAATYDHADAAGFIKLFGLPIRAAAGLAAEESLEGQAGQAEQAEQAGEDVQAGENVTAERAVSKLIEEVVEVGAH